MFTTKVVCAAMNGKAALVGIYMNPPLLLPMIMLYSLNYSMELFDNVCGKKLMRLLLRSSPYLIIFVLAFGYIFVTNIVLPRQAPKQIAAVKAEPYIWPEGCVQKRYDYYDQISAKCMDDRYLLTNEYAESLGADTRTRRGKWLSYRVGNDIVGIDEYDEKLEVRRIKRNVFYQGE